MRYHLASFLSVLGAILILLYAFLNPAQAQTTVGQRNVGRFNHHLPSRARIQLGTPAL